MKHAGNVALVAGLTAMVGAFALVAWHYYRASEVVFISNWQVEYEKMPSSDTALFDWLNSQPGVTDVSVSRERKTLSIRYEIKGGEPTPNVLDQAEALGYSERGSISSIMRNK